VHSPARTVHYFFSLSLNMAKAHKNSKKRIHSAGDVPSAKIACHGQAGNSLVDKVIDYVASQSDKNNASLSRSSSQDFLNELDQLSKKLSNNNVDVVDVVEPVTSNVNISTQTDDVCCDCVTPNPSVITLMASLANLTADCIAQKSQIADLRDVVKLLAQQVEFLLSVVGAVKSRPAQSAAERDATASTSAMDSSVSGSSGHQSTATAADVHNTNSGASYADVVRLPAAELSRSFRQSVVAAVYVDQQRSGNQAANVVISGLPPHLQVADNTVVRNILSSELKLSVNVVKSKRLGRPSAGRVQPLLVVLRSADEADRVMASAKKLRQSPHAAVRDCVYINRHLTAAQSRAAFEVRHNRLSTTRLASSVRPGMRSSVPPSSSSPSAFLDGDATRIAMNARAAEFVPSSAMDATASPSPVDAPVDASSAAK